MAGRVTIDGVEKSKKFLKDYVNETAKQAAIALRKKLVKITPVDTGWARANWIVKEDQAQTQPQPRHSNSNPVARLQLADSAERIIRIKKRIKGDVYVGNSVPYIIKLNEKGSRRSGGEQGTGVSPLWVNRAIETSLGGVFNEVNKVIRTGTHAR